VDELDMPSFKEHCDESERLLGRPYPEVHKWLDEFAGRPPWGMKHRRFRHHAAGIEQVLKLFGNGAAAAARQHIIADLKMEGWTEDQPFPRDEQDYVRIGLF